MITQRSVALTANEKTAVSTVVNLVILNPEDNASPVYVGDINVTTSIGMPIEPGKGFSYEFVPTQPPAPTYVISPTGQSIILIETVYEPTTQQRTPEQFNLTISGNGGGPDVLPPLPSSAVADDTHVVLTFGENLRAYTGPELTALLTAFTFNETITAITAPTANTLSLAYAGPVVSGTYLVLTYNKPGADPVLEDVALNDVASFSIAAINSGTGTAPDTITPYPTALSVNSAGTTLTITFSENLNTTTAPIGAFAVTGAGSGNRAVTAAVATTNTVTLTLGASVLAGESVTVTYTKPGSAPWIADAAGNAADSFTAPSVNNKTGSFPSGSVPVYFGATRTALNANSTDKTDGVPGVCRPVGIDAFLDLTWNANKSWWETEPFDALVQADTWAMDLSDKSGANLIQYCKFSNAVPYGKWFSHLDTSVDLSSAAFTGGTGVISVVTYVGEGHAAYPLTSPSGTIQIRDNYITYTGINTGTNDITGCTCTSGSKGTIPVGAMVYQGQPGGFGMMPIDIEFAGEFYAAGFHLQEYLISQMNGAPTPDSSKALTIAPYWFQYNSGEGTAPITAPLTGGLGVSASLTGTTDPGGLASDERHFTWAEAADWSDLPFTPTAHSLICVMAGKMPSGSVGSGEVLDTNLKLRWIGAG
jgi:hypothetical protein